MITCLGVQLREGKQCRGTVASMQPNEDTFDLLNPKVRAILRVC